MGYLSGRRHSLGVTGAALLLLSACTADGTPSGPDLDKILITEKAQSLAAAKIGKAGGMLQISEGEYAGTMLEVPPGALAGDAVLSIYPATLVQEASGYRPVGPAIRLAATIQRLRADAVLTLPFAPDKVSESSRSSLAFLRQSSDQLSTVAGAAYFEGFARAAIREFSDYSVALDLAILRGDMISDTATARCPALPGGTSLQSAISATRVMARFTLPSTEQVLTARSFGADGCGYSKGWEVVWYSVIGGNQATLEVWPSGVSAPAAGTKPVCATTANAFKGSANSTFLSDDLAARLGGTQPHLAINIRACNDSVPSDPSRIRLTVPADGRYVEYTADGIFLFQSF